MTPAASDPIAVNSHVVSQGRRATGERYYRCVNCGEKAARPAEFHHFSCSGGDDR